MKLLRDTFYENTGLRLEIICEMNIIPFTEDRHKMLRQIGDDLEKVNKLAKNFDTSRVSEETLSQYVSNKLEYNFFGTPRFYSEGFVSKPINYKNNVIEIEVISGEFYFSNSLMKSFIEIGGRFVNASGEEIDKQMLDSWNSLKKWDQYNRLNRPQK